MCLMWGLVEGNQKKSKSEEKVLDTDSIANYYAMWVKSGPFDIGTTTKGGVRPLAQAPKPLAYVGKQNAAKVNQSSRSNGSLMRCTPMAVFLSNLTDPKDLLR